MCCSIGSKFPTTMGIVGGYAPGCYPLCKVRGVNVFEEMKDHRDLMRYTIEAIMNEQPFKGAKYITHHMGLQLEFAQPGELYMITQGSGGGYGDVLEREPEAVSREYLDDLISMNTVTNIYHVIVDAESGAVDLAATTVKREAERAKRKQLGKPYKEFVLGWETEHPPEGVPYYGSWKDRSLIYRSSKDDTCSADNIVSIMMRNPKDVRIEKLEAELAALRAEIKG